MIEQGAASIIITLSKGNIEVLHGTDKVLLAKLENAPHGTWDAIFSLLKSLGFEGLAIKATKEQSLPNPATFSVGAIKGKRSYVKGKGKAWEDKLVHWDEVAVKGVCILVSERDKFYGGEASREYRSNVLHNPTWKQVYAEFKASIPVTGDYHHCFLEGLSPGVAKVKTAGVKHYTFSAGS